MSAESVTNMLGKPNRKFSADGVEVWEYVKSAEAGGTVNTVMAVGTFGIASGKDSFYVDILRFRIKNNRVIDVQTEENVHGVLGGR